MRDGYGMIVGATFKELGDGAPKGWQFLLELN